MEPQNIENTQKKNKIGLVLGIVAVAGVAIASFAGNKKAEDVVQNPTDTAPVATETQATTPPPATKQTAPSEVAAGALYKNGTYTADGTYMSPGGQDMVAISITLKDDIITDASITGMQGDLTSKRYQEKFASGYKAYVVGKKIADVQVGKVSGSSLTATGFNAALAKIKAQAKA